MTSERKNSIEKRVAIPYLLSKWLVGFWAGIRMSILPISCCSRCISCHDKFCWWSMTRLFSDETNCCQTKMMSRLLRCVGGSHVWWPGSMVSCLPSHMWQCSSSDSKITTMLLMATIRWSNGSECDHQHHYLSTFT